MANVAEKVATESNWIDGAATPTRSVRWALASLSLATLLSSLGTSIASVGLPSLMQAFGASFQSVQWVVLAYLLAITTMIVSAGRLADIVGRRPLLLAGIALFTIASALCALAPTLGLLIAARAAQGLGAAVMMALTLAFVAGTVPKARTGSAMGLLGAMSSIGTMLGPSLGGLLIAGAGWRAMFLVNVPLGLLAFALAWRALPKDGRSGPGRSAFDTLGTVLLGLTLAAYALAMTLGKGSVGLLNLALLVVAALGVALFIVTELKVETPLVRLAAFGDRMLTASLAMSVVVSTVVMGQLVVAPFYLSRALGLDPATVGLVMSTAPLVATLAAVPAGRLVDRFGAQPTMIAGLASLVLGTVALSSIRIAFGIPGYVVPVLALSGGYALFQTANNAAVMGAATADQRGVVSGLVNLSRNLGLITGASLMGAIFAAASAGADSATPSATLLGMQVTFRFAMALALFALGLAVFCRRAATRSKERAEA
ncbi:MFS transporter [Mesorhizobium abyssinicae]|uniref:MFS transporter n=1 Tax=Mesorhizobium abyssinicae TaxID=1209958 RepID=A0ABU5AIN9_9HYPH|nr:MFS transporter [Mesorhizobium abyssinicae]MDX8537159.1 MFS transporter [Mesorhizobium abyssinicae]